MNVFIAKSEKDSFRQIQKSKGMSDKDLITLFIKEGIKKYSA